MNAGYDLRAHLVIAVLTTVCGTSLAAEKPNILWITSEDNGPHLGCYGDAFAATPNLDALAKKGLIYLNAWSNAPVCAPARTTLISGLYPTSTGSQHMRSQTRLPSGFRMYPQYLRDAGYYCTNNSKEDYNLQKPGQVWDASSRTAHWKDRQPGQPFFAIFNHTVTHESQIRKRPHQARHDAAKVRVPAYHPDIPEVRQDWAQYYDKLSTMDARVGENLRELADAGLADDTIVFYYGDHGPGMPRSKRWPYNSGLHIPLIVYVPEKFRATAGKHYRPGESSDRLVAFVDLAPTVLSLAGIRPPRHFQGHAFLGQFVREEQPYSYGFRGRMDERYDLVRTVRDKQFIYLRHYMPHRIYGQHVAYMFRTPTTRRWYELFQSDQLKGPTKLFWQQKPTEELYDLRTDPDEVNNLAQQPEHRETLERLRRANREHILAIRDLGFLPEEEIHVRAAESTPYEVGRDPTKYPLLRILTTAELASDRSPAGLSELLEALDDDHSAVRYWAATGFLVRGKEAVRKNGSKLREVLKDPSPSVRIVAAEALAKYGTDEELALALDVLVQNASLEESSLFVAMLALNALDELNEKARSRREQIAALPQRTGKTKRLGNYVPRLLEKILADLAVP